MDFLFDLDSIDLQSFDTLEPGIYFVSVTDAEFKQSAAGNEYLKLQFKVIGEKGNGRVVFENLNLFHDNAQVKYIAMSKLKSLLVNGGSSNVKFSGKEELLNSLYGIQVNANLGIKKQEGYNDSNIIISFAKIPIGQQDQTPF